VTSPKESGTPGTITAGYWLVVVGSALGVLATLYVLLNKQTVIDASVQANKDSKVTPDMIASTVNTILIVSLVVTVVLAALAVWFAGKVRDGLKKSRTGLMITLLLGLFFQMLTNTLGVVTALIAIAGLVLFFFRQSSDYLAEREQLT
jgi:heme/copper-type cytochrome/quinol oxidase subunit 3